jgi:hypothetical protein
VLYKFRKKYYIYEHDLYLEYYCFFFIITENDSAPSNELNWEQKFIEMVNSTKINGKVRLTAEGTVFFKSFNYNKIKRKEFFDNLKSELAKAVPVIPERITTNERHEIDISIPRGQPEQYILSINIEKTKNRAERSADLVAKDLDILIRNKLVTVIGSGEYSNYLDHEYGYEPIRK